MHSALGILRRRGRRRPGKIPVRTAGQRSPLRCRRERRHRTIRRCGDPPGRTFSLHHRTPDRAGRPVSYRSRPRRSHALDSRRGTHRRSGIRRWTSRRRSRALQPEQQAGSRPAGAHALGRWWWPRVVEHPVVDPSAAARRPGARRRRPGLGVDESSVTVDAEARRAAAETVEVLWPREPDQACPAIQPPPLDVPPGRCCARALPAVKTDEPG